MKWCIHSSAVYACVDQLKSFQCYNSAVDLWMTGWQKYFFLLLILLACTGELWLSLVMIHLLSSHVPSLHTFPSNISETHSSIHHSVSPCCLNASKWLMNLFVKMRQDLSVIDPAIINFSNHRTKKREFCEICSVWCCKLIR